MAKRVDKHVQHGERGQALIEMGLITALLLLILMGVVDFGRAFNNYVIITNAAREGARYGSHFPWDTPGIQNVAIAEASGYGVVLDTSNIVVQCLDVITPIPCPGADYDNSDTDYSIRVTITHTFPTVMAGLIGFESLSLSNGAEMVIFGPDPNSQD